MTKRCPWCGENIESNGFNSMLEYRCKCCGKKSVVKRSLMIYVIPASFAFVLILLTRSPYSAISLLPLVASTYFGSILAPLERVTKKFVPVKTAECSAELSEKWNIIKKRTTLFEDKILFICFINDEEQPISHSYAVSIDELSFGKESFAFRISFMPKSKGITDFPAGTGFLLFEENNKIAKGTLATDIKYPRYETAETPL